MATKRNPFEDPSISWRGSRVIAHRDVEAARVRATIEGEHPYKNQFRERIDFDDEDPEEAGVTEYEAPDGDGVEVRYAPSGDPGAPPFPEPQFVEIDGRRMSVSAANVYLAERYGLNLTRGSSE